MEGIYSCALKVKYCMKKLISIPLFIFFLFLLVGVCTVNADILTVEEVGPDGTVIIKYVNSKAIAIDRRVTRKKNKSNEGVFLYYRDNPSLSKNYVPEELTYGNRVFKKLNPVNISYHSRELSSRGTERSGTLDLSRVIEDEAKKNNIDPLLIYLIVKYESNFNPYAVSRSGAMGLMQLMPGTAEMLGVSDAYDPYQNIAGGASYFCTQLSRFGDLRFALAAYNAGPGKVAEYGGVPPFSETINYVENIFSEYNQYRSTSK